MRKTRNKRIEFRVSVDEYAAINQVAINNFTTISGLLRKLIYQNFTIKPLNKK